MVHSQLKVVNGHINPFESYGHFAFGRILLVLQSDHPLLCNDINHLKNGDLLLFSNLEGT